MELSEYVICASSEQCQLCQFRIQKGENVVAIVSSLQRSHVSWEAARTEEFCFHRREQLVLLTSIAGDSILAIINCCGVVDDCQHSLYHNALASCCHSTCHERYEPTKELLQATRWSYEASPAFRRRREEFYRRRLLVALRYVFPQLPMDLLMSILYWVDNFTLDAASYWCEKVHLPQILPILEADLDLSRKLFMQ